MAWHISRALMEAYENSRCSQEQEEAYSAVSCLDGAPSVPLNTQNIPRLYSSSDRMMDFCRRSPFGMTCEPLTADLGAGLLMWFRVVFLAQTFQPQARGQELKENTLGSGEKWQGSFVKYDPATSSWKTHQCSLLGGWEEFSETWPRWGTMRNGECWERTTSELATAEKESGYWPTPSGVSGAGHSVGAISEWGGSHNLHRGTKDRNLYCPALEEWMMGWPERWSALTPLETDKYLSWRQGHGKF